MTQQGPVLLQIMKKKHTERGTCCGQSACRACPYYPQHKLGNSRLFDFAPWEEYCNNDISSPTFCTDQVIEKGGCVCHKVYFKNNKEKMESTFFDVTKDDKNIFKLVAKRHLLPVQIIHKVTGDPVTRNVKGAIVVGNQFIEDHLMCMATKDLSKGNVTVDNDGFVQPNQLILKGEEIRFRYKPRVDGGY